MVGLFQYFTKLYKFTNFTGLFLKLLRCSCQLSCIFSQLKSLSNRETVYRVVCFSDYQTFCGYFVDENMSEEERNTEENESEDDDVQWYKNEVGEEPDEGRSSSFILMDRTTVAF